jgi:hypothetical protein
METLFSLSEGTSVGVISDVYRIDVKELSARLALVDGTSAQAVFFLQLSSESGYRNENLSALLNDETAQFLVMRCDEGITFMAADAIAYVAVAGKTRELAFLDRVGASRRAAEVRLRTGEELVGEFLSLAPPNRSRLSDVLNEPGQRFLVFEGGGCTYHINRNAIQQVSPR